MPTRLFMAVIRNARSSNGSRVELKLARSKVSFAVMARAVIDGPTTASRKTCVSA